MDEKTAVNHASPIADQSSIDGTRRQSEDIGAEAVAVPILSLHAADSPRLNGEDKAHVKSLAETDAPLPPILVDRRTMRVIDGMHRLMAASLRGRETIDVIFFDGSDADVFLRAVEQNVAHGLPLSLSDKKAAAARIVVSHPHMSNGAIAKATGLAAKTVEAIRKSSAGKPEASARRVGRDGKIRPLDSSAARRKAAELLTEQPETSVRDVARAVGMSPATVLDVRRRLSLGESPVPQGAADSQAPAEPAGGMDTGDAGGMDTGDKDTAAASPAAPADASEADDRGSGHDHRTGKVPASETGQGTPPGVPSPGAGDPAAMVEKLLHDPSFCGNEHGRTILRLLHVNAIAAGHLRAAVRGVPPHRVLAVLWLARQYSKMWDSFAQELEGRARIIDPVGSVTEGHPYRRPRNDSCR